MLECLEDTVYGLIAIVRRKAKQQTIMGKTT